MIYNACTCKNLLYNWLFLHSGVIGKICILYLPEKCPLMQRCPCPVTVIYSRWPAAQNMKMFTSTHVTSQQSGTVWGFLCSGWLLLFWLIIINRLEKSNLSQSEGTRLHFCADSPAVKERSGCGVIRNMLMLLTLTHSSKPGQFSPQELIWPLDTIKIWINMVINNTTHLLPPPMLKIGRSVRRC